VLSTTRTSSAAIVCSLLLAGGACAQERSGASVNPLSEIPTPVHYSPAEGSRTASTFDCEGRRYRLELLEAAIDGPELRRVSIVSFETPSGPLGDSDRARLQTALEPYLLLFHVGIQCRGEVFGLTFTGRRRGDVDNSSFVAWFENDRLTALR
jgi:hypothetical protein